MIEGLVLAAGESRRFGTADKLLARVDGIAVVRRTVSAYVNALGAAVVVIQPEQSGVRDALQGLKVTFVENPDFRSGQSASLRAGIQALSGNAVAVVVGVADQPLLTSGVIEQIVAVWRKSSRQIVVPVYGGSPGNPALYTRSLFPELAAVTGDVGGRPVRDRYGYEEVAIADAAAGLDVDEPGDLEALSI